MKLFCRFICYLFRIVHGRYNVILDGSFKLSKMHGRALFFWVLSGINCINFFLLGHLIDSSLVLHISPVTAMKHDLLT